MNSIIATSTGTRITTRYAPSRNFSDTTIARTTAVRTRAARVDGQPPAPARLRLTRRQCLTMPDLAEREAEEDADRVERDQRVRVAAERRQQHEGDRRQQDDPPRVREPVAAERELAGHVAVLGQDRGEAREGVEARVRGEEQDQRGARGERRDERRPARRTRLAPPAPRPTDRPPRSGRRPYCDREDREPDEQDPEQHRHRGHRVGGVLRLGWLERRDAVRDRLDAGQRDRPAGERLQQQEDAERLGPERHRVGSGGTAAAVPEDDLRPAPIATIASASPTNR